MTTYAVYNSHTNELLGKVNEDGVVGDAPAQDLLEVFEADMQAYGFEEAMAHWSRNYTFVPDEKGVKKEYEVEATGTISKIDEERRNIFGWAYVSHDADGNVNVDKSGEFVDDTWELEKAAYNFVVKSRSGDFDHTNLKSSEMIESMVFTPEKIEKMGLPAGIMPTGWWVGFHFEDEKDWEEAKKRPAFSIHGKGQRKEVPDDFNAGS